jgi:hypothetical protein
MYVVPCKTRNFNVVYIYIYIYTVYGLTFGNAESRLFLFATQCFNIEKCRKFSCVTVVCKHVASYQDYPNYKWDLIR